MAENVNPSQDNFSSTQTENTESQQFWELPANMNVLPTRLTRNNRVQRQLGQVVRGVIPGVAPQPEYHPNPYLQHLYNRAQDESREDNFDIADIEAQLQEVIAQNEAQHDTGQHTTDVENGTRGQQIRLDWKIFLGSFSFGIILALRLMIDHFLGILIFIGLSTVFYYANNYMIEIVHVTSLRESPRKRKVMLSCIWLIVFLGAQIFGIYWFFKDQDLWKVYLYQLPLFWKGELFDLLWITMITDHVVRFGTIIMKSVIAITPLFCLPQKRKGKCYMCIEILSQFYRMTLPVTPWIHYLYDHPRSVRLVVAAVLCVVYICLKVWGLSLEYVKLMKAFKALLNDTKFGVQPSLEEIKSRGENCPICQDDYQDPVMLACKHIFCENCVSIWFDREKTCPMCRAEIQADSPVWQDGSTSAHLQWH